jgi:hypothetical protein
VTGLVFLLAAALAVGDPMPRLEGEFLNGKKAVLPDQAYGRVTLVALGFSYESRHSVDSWVKRFRDEFGRRDETTFYEVPVMSGMARLARFFIENGMRRGTPRGDHARVLTVYGNSASEWHQLLDVRRDDLAYLMLLDRNGHVRWLHNGALSEQSWRELKQSTEYLIAAGK